MAADLAVSSSDFESQVLGSDVPVLVDFWAEWCGPCRMIGPAIQELAVEYAGRAKVVKVDIDSNPDIASRYAVMSIPALLLFKGGQVVDSMVGAAPKDRIAEMIKRAL